LLYKASFFWNASAFVFSLHSRFLIISGSFSWKIFTFVLSSDAQVSGPTAGNLTNFLFLNRAFIRKHKGTYFLFSIAKSKLKTFAAGTGYTGSTGNTGSSGTTGSTGSSSGTTGSTGA
jgi:hypothetical protein